MSIFVSLDRSRTSLIVERFITMREVVDSFTLVKVLKLLRNDGTAFALQTARPSRGSDDHVKSLSRLP